MGNGGASNTGAAKGAENREMTQGLVLPMWYLPARGRAQTIERHHGTSWYRSGNEALHSGSLYANTQKVHRPICQSTLHFDVRNILQICLTIDFYHSALAYHRNARALAAGLPCQDHVYITTDESLRVHNHTFNEMPCKVDSNENPRSLEKYPTPPQPGKPSRQTFSLFCASELVNLLAPLRISNSQFFGKLISVQNICDDSRGKKTISLKIWNDLAPHSLASCWLHS